MKCIYIAYTNAHREDPTCKDIYVYTYVKSPYHRVLQVESLCTLYTEINMLNTVD